MLILFPPTFIQRKWLVRVKRTEKKKRRNSCLWSKRIFSTLHHMEKRFTTTFRIKPDEILLLRSFPGKVLLRHFKHTFNHSIESVLKQRIIKRQWRRIQSWREVCELTDASTMAVTPTLDSTVLAPDRRPLIKVRKCSVGEICLFSPMPGKYQSISFLPSFLSFFSLSVFLYFFLPSFVLSFTALLFPFL